MPAVVEVQHGSYPISSDPPRLEVRGVRRLPARGGLDTSLVDTFVEQSHVAHLVGQSFAAAAHGLCGGRHGAGLVASTRWMLRRGAT